MRVFKLFALFPLVLLIGCATSAKVEKMTPESGARLASDSMFSRRVFIDSVSGGDKANPHWNSEISSEGYEAALRQALEDAGALSDLRSGATYRLSVNLDKVEQPLGGLSKTVTTTVTYGLYEVLEGRVIFRKQFVTPYTASWGSILRGTGRMRLANEGAARENIEAFISYLVSGPR